VPEFIFAIDTMKKNNILIGLAIALSGILLACQNDTAVNNMETPEGVVKRWQGLVDSSKFEAAKTFSTERAIRWLEKNKALTDSGDSLVYPMNFKEISCKIDGDSAVCNCIYTMPEDTTTYKDVYLAKKINGKWVVDLNQDELEMFQ
jgi:hypothetical protein